MIDSYILICRKQCILLSENPAYWIADFPTLSFLVTLVDISLLSIIITNTDNIKNYRISISKLLIMH